MEASFISTLHDPRYLLDIHWIFFGYFFFCSWNKKNTKKTKQQQHQATTQLNSTQLNSTQPNSSFINSPTELETGSNKKEKRAETEPKNE